MIKYYFVNCYVPPQDRGTCTPFNLVKILEIDETCFFCRASMKIIQELDSLMTLRVTKK